MHGIFKPDTRIKKPLPCCAGNDKRQSHRIKINRAQETFTANFLIQQNRQSEPKHRTNNNIERCEDRQIRYGAPPMRQSPEFGVILQANKIIGRQHFAVCQRQQTRIGNKTIYKNQNDEKAGCHNKFGQQLLQSAATIHGQSPRLVSAPL